MTPTAMRPAVGVSDFPGAHLPIVLVFGLCDWAVGIPWWPERGSVRYTAWGPFNTLASADAAAAEDDRSPPLLRVSDPRSALVAARPRYVV